MIDVLPKGRILMQHRESQGNRDTTTYTTIPDHNIQSTAQSMAQALPTNEHLHREIGNDDCSPDWRVQFYVSPYVRTQSTLCDLRRCLLKKRIISVREESRIRERDFEIF
ncbi:Phosphoglycerate mutase-like protein AT74 [Glycine max]|nr:Phosphoglycerate mutase-like protein AT74 [Glycine max]